MDPTTSRLNPAQRDAQAFFRLLLTHLQTNAAPDSGICDLFISQYVTAARSLDAARTQYEVLDIPLEVRGSSLLVDALGKFVEMHLLPDQYFGDPSGAEFTELAPILVFSLRRVDFNVLTGRPEQISDFFSFPEELDMAKFARHIRESSIYDLFAVLVQSGQGHHFAFLRIADQWYHFNDSIVSIASRDQATTQNFGGSSTAAAYMLMYVKRSRSQMLFRPCEFPLKIRAYVSEVALRAPGTPRSQRSVRTFRLITEEDVRQRVLRGESVANIDQLPRVLELDDGSTNQDLYTQIAVQCGRELHMLRVWKTDHYRMPTTIISGNTLKCPRKDMVLFVQDLLDPQLPVPKAAKVAFLCFFFAGATPKVQFIGTAPINPTQTVAQVFPFAWSILGIPGVLFNVFCENIHPYQPISQSVALIDLGISESVFLILEAGVHVQTRFQVDYFKPADDNAVSYYSKLRPAGDKTAPEYLERRMPQYRIQVFRVSDHRFPVVTITAPEDLSVVELPDFILFATKDKCDPKRDTFQLFRQALDEDRNEIMPFVLRADTTLKVMFISELKRLRADESLTLYYDILRGVLPEQLKSMVVRTCDIYESPIRRAKRIRIPMRLSEPLGNLLQLIRSEIFPAPAARLLRDDDGVVRLLDGDEQVDERVIIRFDVVPMDQRTLAAGEFLVVALLCRWTKNQDRSASLGQSFLFRIIPGELVEATKRRITDLRIIDQRLVNALCFQVNARILNGNECIEPLVKPNNLVRLIMPNRARANHLLKTEKANGRRRSERADDIKLYFL
jgi:hypothetical protein